ncbi:MAG: CBS domain-containing protein [Polaribacter sp.]|jgi:CBS domain-containing protein
MYYNTPLSEVMTKDLTTVGPDDTLEVVDYIFNNNSFRHLPVVDKDGKILGMISKLDYNLLCNGMTLFRKDLEKENNLSFFRTLLSSEVMTKDLAKLPPSTKISVAAGIFKENLFHAIPIVTEGDKLIGLITTIDMINYAYDQPALNFK